MKTKTVAIVDNDSWTISALRMFLNTKLPSAEIIWSALLGQEALEKIGEEPRPHVLLVDMSLSDMRGADVIRRIRRYDQTVILLAITAFPLEQYAMQASVAGAQALISKRYPKQIADSIDAADASWSGPDVDGVPFQTAKQAFYRVSAEKLSGIESLTTTEQRVVELCAQGFTSVEIAHAMGNAVATVNTHLRRALDKTGARNRTQLVAMWVRHQSMR